MFLFKKTGKGRAFFVWILRRLKPILRDFDDNLLNVRILDAPRKQLIIHIIQNYSQQFRLKQ